MFFAACKNKQPSIKNTNEVSNVQTLFEKKKTYIFSEEITENAKKGIEDWKTYFRLSNFLSENYANISPTRSLEMSGELADIVKKTKDSLQIQILNTKSVHARLNTLNSEVLRLKDMATIPSIKPEDVAIQTEKIIVVFNSVNSKINAVFSQKVFDEDLDFDELKFDFE